MTTPGSTAASDAVIAGIGERALIDRIRRRLPAPPASVPIGIGDDAAVYEPDRGALQVLTTDAVVEGVHFERRYSTMADVGHKALAVNISDIAAMGGTPSLALLSLILPENLAVADVDALLDGLIPVAEENRVAVVGGNISRSPGPLIVDVTLCGSVRRRRVVTRGGGRPGDQLYVTGAIGAAVAGLAWLRQHASGPTDLPGEPDLASCVQRHRRPEPRARVGALLGRTRAATACMDLSDGLADAVRQIAESSGTGAVIDAARLPIHAGAREWFSSNGQDAVEASLAGGDDYELLFAVASRNRGRFRLIERQARGVRLTRIGELTTDPVIAIERQGTRQPLPAGFVHFQAT